MEMPEPGTRVVVLPLLSLETDEAGAEAEGEEEKEELALTGAVSRTMTNQPPPFRLNAGPKESSREKLWEHPGWYLQSVCPVKLRVAGDKGHAGGVQRRERASAVRFELVPSSATGIARLLACLLTLSRWKNYQD